MAGITLDTGALIAIERGSRRLQALLAEAAAHGADIAVPAGVVAQAWRASPRQALLSRFLRLTEVTTVVLDEAEAKAAGALCGRAETADVVDASVVVCARSRGHAVLTGDTSDLALLDPTLRAHRPRAVPLTIVSRDTALPLSRVRRRERKCGQTPQISSWKQVRTSGGSRDVRALCLSPRGWSHRSHFSFKGRTPRAAATVIRRLDSVRGPWERDQLERSDQPALPRGGSDRDAGARGREARSVGERQDRGGVRRDRNGVHALGVGPDQRQALRSGELTRARGQALARQRLAASGVQRVCAQERQ